MKQCLIIGVDVSKATLDIFIKPLEKQMVLKNCIPGFKLLLKELRSFLSAETEVLVVMEHTGLYSLRFESFLQTKGIGYCKLPALEIKRSLGVTRGKSDQVDARRIAAYGWLRRDVLTADRVIEKDIQRVKMLTSLRSKLVKDRSGYICRLKEIKNAGICNQDDLLIITQKKMIEQLTKHIGEVECALKDHINNSVPIKTTSDLLQSIKGVGWIVAAYLISSTENFQKFKDPRKYLCYAGLAPFKNQSGTSINGRAKISHLADKRAKALLDRAACCAIQFDPELKAYYTRRVKEGKSKRNCINIIRAKIVMRAFAVIKRQTPFVQVSLAA
jgi:transposase